jgi:prolyl oligopeptidase
VVDVIHGVPVADPYRWLEEGESEEVRAWTEAQNARTQTYVDALPGHDRLLARARDLLSLGFVSNPVVRATAGGEHPRLHETGARRYFHVRREGTQNQPVLCVRDGVAGEDRVLVDPARLSEDGTTALDWWEPSVEGALLAWGRSEEGSEESTLYVRDVATGEDLADVIPHTRFASVAWLPGGRSFYYTRHPDPGTVPPGDEKYYGRVFHHVLGTDRSDDPLVFGADRDKLETYGVYVSPNGRWLVVSAHTGWVKVEIFVRDLSAGPDAPWVTVAAGADAIHMPIVRDECLYLLTNEGHPRFRLVRVDYARPERASWEEILPEHEDVLDGVTVVGEVLIAEYMHDASTRLERFTREGVSLGAMPLPSIGSATVAGPPAPFGDEAFVNFTSFTTPFEVHRVDMATGEWSLWDKVRAEVELPPIRVSRRYATSKDGTRVPMFVVERADAAPAGPRPVVLYGYGGFNINQTPAFSVRALLAVEQGAVWVTTVLRGGGEFGEAWHHAGMLEKKQNVFDDFFACAGSLVNDGTTTPEHLGAFGGSNGGLLVAAALIQRPDLFRAGVSAVPLCDMLRYHRFRIGKLWITEYGDPEDAAAFRYLYAYSPYHRVVDGTRYPAVLFTTAESDSRVDPMHARKMAARMQEAEAGLAEGEARPVLLRVESKAGHGAGKPIAKVAVEIAESLGFLLHEIGAF